MGVLDDAIRQHIELQRAHGASEEELRRKEQEALGPARRESTQPAEAEAEAEAALEDTGEEFDREQTKVLPSLEDEEPPGPDPEDFHEAPVAGEPEPFAPAEPAAEEPGAFADHDPFADDEPFAPEPAPDSVVEEELEDDEDVLEETPEFLQETPEHDRLWFEQKPPRDFDFDDDK